MVLTTPPYTMSRPREVEAEATGPGAGSGERRPDGSKAQEDGGGGGQLGAGQATPRCHHVRSEPVSRAAQGTAGRHGRTQHLRHGQVSARFIYIIA